MQRYSAYRQSGVEWLGDVPNHWKVDRIKDVFEDNSTNIAVDDLKKRKNVAHYSIPAFDNKKEPEYVDGEEIDSNKTFLSGNQLLFSRLNCHKPRVWLIFEDDNFKICSTEFFIHSDKYGKVNLKFYEYLLTDDSFIKLASSYQSSVTNSHRRINPEDYYTFNIPFPPKVEQILIAQYLDKATSDIDKVVETKRKQLEKLEQYKKVEILKAVTKGLDKNVKLKESGIDWIGEIPEHWKVERLKFVLDKINSGVTPKGGSTVYQDSGVPLIRSQNVLYDKLDMSDVAYISQQIHDDMGNSKVSNGDVLLNITGASLGRCYYYNYAEEANVNQHVCILRPNQKITTHYLHYLMISEVGQSQIFTGFTGSSREGLNFEAIKNFKITLPKKGEQKEIADYLDKFCDDIQKENNIIEQQIDKLQQYRKSLIHECVTGKRKVIE